MATSDDLRRLQRPIDQRKWGESSWVNYWLGRDEHLWTDTARLAGHAASSMTTDASDRRARAVSPARR